jgi:hypothetical protein
MCLCVRAQAGDRLFASTSPPPQLVLLEELKPSKLAKDKAPASTTTTTTTSASNVQQKAVEVKAGGGPATSEAGAHDGDEGGNDSGSNSMENSQEGSTEEHEEEESGDFEDSPETTESEEVEEEEKKGRIRSAALEWMGEEEMERRSAQAEKEEADRLQEKRNRRKTDLLLQQQQQLTHKLPSSQDWTEKILSILVPRLSSSSRARKVNHSKRTRHTHTRHARTHTRAPPHTRTHTRTPTGEEPHVSIDHGAAGGDSAQGVGLLPGHGFQPHRRPHRPPPGTISPPLSRAANSNNACAHRCFLLFFFQEAYNAVVEKVKQRLNGSLGGIFLQLFEEEMSKYRRTSGPFSRSLPLSLS